MRKKLQNSNPIKYSNRASLDRDLRTLSAACSHKVPPDTTDLEKVIEDYQKKVGQVKSFSEIKENFAFNNDSQHVLRPPYPNEYQIENPNRWRWETDHRPFPNMDNRPYPNTTNRPFPNTTNRPYMYPNTANRPYPNTANRPVHNTARWSPTYKASESPLSNWKSNNWQEKYNKSPNYSPSLYWKASTPSPEFNRWQYTPTHSTNHYPSTASTNCSPCRGGYKAGQQNRNPSLQRTSCTKTHQEYIQRSSQGDFQSRTEDTVSFSRKRLRYTEKTPKVQKTGTERSGASTDDETQDVASDDSFSVISPDRQESMEALTVQDSQPFEYSSWVQKQKETSKEISGAD